MSEWVRSKLPYAIAWSTPGVPRGWEILRDECGNWLLRESHPELSPVLKSSAFGDDEHRRLFAISLQGMSVPFAALEAWMWAVKHNCHPDDGPGGINGDGDRSGEVARENLLGYKNVSPWPKDSYE